MIFIFQLELFIRKAYAAFQHEHKVKVLKFARTFNQLIIIL